MISTVPTYVALSAVGFGATAAAEMTGHVASGHTLNALATFQTVWALVTLITGAIVLAALLLWPISEYTMHFDASVTGPALKAATALAVYAFFAIQTSMLQALFRSTNRYASGTLCLDLIGLIEGLAVLCVAVAGGHLLAAALCMLGVRVAGFGALYWWARRCEPWFQLGISGCDRSILKRLLHPSLASLTLAAANALSLQGTVMLLGLMVSPAVAASFSTARTICRVPLQVSDLLGRATLPELSRAAALGDKIVFYRLSITNIIVALAVLGPFCIFISIFGDNIATSISRSNLTFDSWIFLPMGVYVLAQGLWIAAGQSLVAINAQHKFGYTYIALSFATAASPFFSTMFTQPSTVVAVVASIVESTTAVMVFRQLRRSLKSLVVTPVSVR
jgi:O-antigen/teichoic acid export membrane protein